MTAEITEHPFVSHMPEGGAKGFILDASEQLPEIDGIAHIMHHEKTGARLLFLENEDDNKSFAISFKTPPENSTGVFHILEHSVLCGSDKFPVKEPFVNLLKTSMQTFLNAMTFPDKTMYPVASTSEQDLLNLMDVYVDAVFHPAIYTKSDIFKQEGWHYELEGKHAPLTYNGVVFNEMKGALSDPESVLYHELNKALFPDTCYAVESGGDPRIIPHLTYEKFLETHTRHYRVDNSYTILYGNMDIERVLGFLDERYEEAAQSTSARGEVAPVAELVMQEPLVSEHTRVPMVTAPENACVGLGYVAGTSHEFRRLLGVEVLLDALMGCNESPIKRALLDANLAGDITAFMVDSQLQPVAVIELQNAFEDVAEKAQDIVRETAEKLVRDGIPRDVLESSLAQLTFATRERDRGMADGVALSMSVMSGWLYSDEDATSYIRYEEDIAALREGLDNGFFETLLNEVFVNNNHRACVEIVPTEVEGTTEEVQELAAHKKQMTDADMEQVMADVEALRVMQETPDTAEGLATLPRLHLADVGDAQVDPQPEVLTDTALPCRFYDMNTRRINYVYHYFGLDHIAWEDIPYVSLLTVLLGRLDTEYHTASELDSFVRTHLGNLTFAAESYTNADDVTKLTMNMVVGVSALSEETASLCTIPQEVWGHTLFADKGKIKDILVQRRVKMEQMFMNEGHACAMSRVTSYYIKAGLLREYSAGVDFYRFLVDLIDNFEDRADALCARLDALCKSIFVANDALVTFVGSPDDCQEFWNDAQMFGLATAPEADRAQHILIPEPTPKNEAFIIPSDVSFAAMGSAGTGFDIEYSGLWPVAGKVLTYDYLWNEVRVKGGAYGTGFRVTAQNTPQFYSYRDPRIDETFDRFKAAGEWLANAEISPEDMEGYIISTVASHDAPVKPRRIARRQDMLFFRGCELGLRERFREEELATTVETLRAQGEKLTRAAEKGQYCVFGNGNTIHSAKSELEIMTLLA